MANLVSAGSEAKIRFYNIRQERLFYEQDCSLGQDEGIYSMITNERNSLLYTGNSAGWIAIWDISNTATGVKEDSMPLVLKFRAHFFGITGLRLIEQFNILVSSSSDCTIRIFSVYTSENNNF